MHPISGANWTTIPEPGIMTRACAGAPLFLLLMYVMASFLWRSHS